MPCAFQTTPLRLLLLITNHVGTCVILQVPLWAEVLFLMRCGSDKVANRFGVEQSFRTALNARGGGGGRSFSNQQNPAEESFNASVRPVFAEALRQWAATERSGNGAGLHRLDFDRLPRAEFLRVCTMKNDGDTKHYHVKHQFKQATGQDLWHKAVISLLNDTDDNPGDVPVGEIHASRQTGGRGEAYWTNRAINELPPLLGDPGEQLCILMGRENCYDRLLLPEFLTAHPLIKPLNTAMVLQRSLWRFVQDYLWRQLVFVRPESSAPVLSLEHCRSGYVPPVTLHHFSKCPWSSSGVRKHGCKPSCMYKPEHDLHFFSFLRVIYLDSTNTNVWCLLNMCIY
jgi:hypothetical protein